MAVAVKEGENSLKVRSKKASKLDLVLSIMCLKKIVTFRSCSGQAECWMLRWCRKERCTWGEMREFILEKASGVKS